MKLLRLLPHVPKGMFLLAAIGSLFAGLATTALVGVVNRLAHGAGATPGAGMAYGALCFFVLAATLVSSVAMSRLSGGLVADLVLFVSRRIVAAPLRSIESIGAARLTQMLTTDCVSLAFALAAIANVLTSLAIVLFCVIFLGTLSGAYLGIFLVGALVGLLVVRGLMRRAARQERLGREELDRVVHHLEAVTHGTKELMLHGARREAFLEQTLGGALQVHRRHAFRQDVFNGAASSVGNLAFFLIIAAVLFLGPHLAAVTSGTIAAFVTTILYLMAPLTRVVTLVPIIVRGLVALGGIERVGLSIEPSTSADGRPIAPAPIELRGVTHAYFRERENASFTLGPIDLRVAPGELLFVVGGNGSGKSTLVKVLTGLYAPERGEIRVGDARVGDANRDAYRQLFSAVFTDFHLLDDLRLLGVSGLDERANVHLRSLELDHKVTIENGVLSTLELSTGQRKRLALLVAYLEDRPFYVFDEWASDQDPSYKEVFYTKILPDLRARGKGVVVVTHDDRYFGVADRVVKLEEGQIGASRAVEVA